MNKEQFLEALELHKQWLKDKSKGKRFEFHGKLEFKLGFSADLSFANLSSADLSSADLSYADLSYANLHSANLSYANLRYADLRFANLSSANLSSSDLDYSSGLSFSFRSTKFKANLRLAAQLAWHFRMIDFGDCEKAKQAQEFLRDLSLEFHLVKNGDVTNERD